METKILPPAPPLSDGTIGKLRRYADLLIEANERVRLVGPRDVEILWRDHVADCLRLLPLLPPSGCVVDVGTGGGLPGAVLAACRPDLHFTLLDSLSRKTNALSKIVADSGIKNAAVVCARSEDFALSNRGRFDCAVVRAVGGAGVIAEYLSPLVALRGRAIAMKGSAAFDELSGLRGRWGELGLGEAELYEYDLNGHSNFMVVWEKVAPCPAVFPRRSGRAEKKGWWL